MDCLGMKNIWVIAFCVMLSSTSITYAQLKKSVHSYQEQGTGHLNDVDNIEKGAPRLQTIEGKVKSPSPKVRD